MEKQEINKDHRHIENPFLNNFNQAEVSQNRLIILLDAMLKEFFNAVKIPCLQSISSVPNQTTYDHKAYDGCSGYTYLLIRLTKFLKEDKIDLKQTNKQAILQFNWQYYLKKAHLQNNAVANFILKKARKKTRVSFYMSEVSTWVCGMHLGHLSKNEQIFRSNQKHLLQCYEWIKEKSDQMLFEVLYGVPGYLYAILQIQYFYEKNQNAIFKVNYGQLVIDLTNLIISQGIKSYEKLSKTKVNYEKLPKDFRLVYYFHQKQYLGGAHGLAGNLNIILLAMLMNNFGENTEKMASLIKKSIQFTLNHLIEGNFASSAGGNKTKLVHFCHGCPGVVHCLAKFAILFPDDAAKMKIKQVIQANLQYIWKYGILKKGFGLCHGISGNGYAFLSPSIQKLLPEKVDEYKKKARIFALLREDKKVMKQIRSYGFEGRQVVGMSDSPYSLMLGLAGDICFAMDVICGSGQFPGFDL